MPINIIESCDADFIPSIDSLFYKVPGTIKEKHVFELTTKDIYSILLQNDVYENKSNVYWKNKFGLDNIDYEMWYKKLFVCKLIPRKILDFNWRIFHGQIVTEKRLINMKLSDGKCASCKLSVEDVTHIFVKCPSYESIWNYVKKMLKLFDVYELTDFNMIVGFLHE